MKPEISLKPNLLKKLPKEVKKLFEIFGDDIRLVGGSVRDLLLKKTVGDFDFATRLLPEKTIKILEKNNIKAIPTGLKYGTVTAVLNHKNFEITTLRKEKNYDGRRPEVEFVDDYFLDAARRDFTINALYLDSKGRFYDYFNGISDLEKHEVRFIGNAKERIEEDYLRILRFFRFSCKYAKGFDSVGLKACISQRKNISKLSQERIRAEFLKMLSNDNWENLIESLEVLKRTKIADEIFSSKLDIKAFKQIKKDASLKLKIAALLLNKKTDLKILAQEICATNLEKKYFHFFQSIEQKLDLESVKQLLAFYEKDLVLDFYLFSLAKKDLNNDKNLKFIEKFSLPNFPLNSADIIQLGFKGRELGIALQESKKFWAKNNFKLDKLTLISFLKNGGANN